MNQSFRSDLMAGRALTSQDTERALKAQLAAENGPNKAPQREVRSCVDELGSEIGRMEYLVEQIRQRTNTVCKAPGPSEPMDVNNVSLNTELGNDLYQLRLRLYVLNEEMISLLGALEL